MPVPSAPLAAGSPVPAEGPSPSNAPSGPAIGVLLNICAALALPLSAAFFKMDTTKSNGYSPPSSVGYFAIKSKIVPFLFSS